eukprot:552731_1
MQKLALLSMSVVIFGVLCTVVYSCSNSKRSDPRVIIDQDDCSVVDSSWTVNSNIIHPGHSICPNVGEASSCCYITKTFNYAIKSFNIIDYNNLEFKIDVRVEYIAHMYFAYDSESFTLLDTIQASQKSNYFQPFFNLRYNISDPNTCPASTLKIKFQTVDDEDDITFDDLVLYGTLKSTSIPTPLPTFDPTAQPTTHPTTNPTVQPSFDPTFEPTTEPTTRPTTNPTSFPTTEPTFESTTEPTTYPTANPTSFPTFEPTTEPTNAPSLGQNPQRVQQQIQHHFRPLSPHLRPTYIPSETPTTEPTIYPSTNPTHIPTINPTAAECITSCVGIPVGNYQSCISCHYFAVCVGADNPT